MQCFGWLVILVLAIAFLASLLRWFEQITEAVELRWWNKVFVLIAAPFSVWFFPSKTPAGRPTAVPLHEPVRGFGTVPLTPKQSPPDTTDSPPPGTPTEFLGMPQIPPRKKSPRVQIDPDQIARLKQKMKEQGMIEDEE